MFMLDSCFVLWELISSIQVLVLPPPAPILRASSQPSPAAVSDARQVRACHGRDAGPDRAVSGTHPGPGIAPAGPPACRPCARAFASPGKGLDQGARTATDPIEPKLQYKVC